MQFQVLNNGMKIPMLGFGTFQINDLKLCKQCVEDAIEVGYRLIDTASLYHNEQAVGEAIQASGIPREDIVVTTKVWPQDHGYEKTLKAFETSRKNLGMKYVDLYLIHQPYGDYYDTWRAMEKLQEEGLVKGIGVCNFSAERLVDLCLNVKIVPVVNQIEIHPFFSQKETIPIMKQYHVQQEAWGPLCEGQRGIFTHPVLTEIGENYGKTAAQVALRWHIQKGNIAIPKTVHKNQLIENMDIWDFALSEQDMEQIKTLDIGHSEIIDHGKPSTAKWLNEWKIHN